jgi:small basic protein (TIGR04137 family)
MEPAHDQRNRQDEAGADLTSVTVTVSSQESFMSQHRSLKGASTIAAKRNVLKRFERVELLKKRGVFKPGDKVTGLPKTKPDA